MIKGQIISGEFGKLIAREKSNQKLELGELVIAETKDGKILLQVFDLLFGSQISQQNLELISGMSLEDNTNLEFFDKEIRNYNLALLKSLITINKNNAQISKSLPNFFSPIRQVTEDDLKFLTKPKNPLFIGNLRSGSKTLNVNIFLDGEKAFAHHILIPATTGKGKSLDENEEVLIKTNNKFSIKSIGEIVNNPSNFKGSEAISMNPKNYSTDFKKIIKFVKHKAPRFMYQVVTESGREILITKDHNLYVLRNGSLALLKTQKITKDDYIPLPLKIKTSVNLKELNLIDLLKDYKDIFVLFDKKIIDKFQPRKECLKILSKYHTRPAEKYNEIINKKRIRITLFNEIINKKPSIKDLKSIRLTDLHKSIGLRAIYPLSKEFLELVGIYIAEGYCLNDNSFRISCSEKEIQKKLEKTFKKIGLKYFWIKKKGKNVDVGVSSSIFTKVLKAISIGNLSGNKRLPTFFMNLSNQNLSTLLRSYFEGDGGVDMKKVSLKRYYKISTTTKSKKLASDICIALYRFGILARCKKRFQRATNSKHKGTDYYRVSISGQKDLLSFSSKIGFISNRKNSYLKGKLNYDGNTNIDLIPVNPKDFEDRFLATNLSQTEFSKKLGYSQQIISRIKLGERRPSRDLFNKVLKKFKNFKDLKHLIKFRWDKIKEIKKIRYNKKYVYDLTIKDNKTFLAGHGGVFVHNSNLMSCMLWDSIDKDYCGILVLDPHDEYYERLTPSKNLVYYTPKDAPPGTKTLKINLTQIKPSHFNGVVDWSQPQQEALHAFYSHYKEKWIEAIILKKPLEVKFGEATLDVVRRRILRLLDLDFVNNQLFCNGVFQLNAGETTIKDICSELESSKTVIINTSGFSGAVEILIGSLITTEIFNKYKSYKTKTNLKDKPVISIVLEEAPRVLGKEVLEKGSNIFQTIAREGRKFKVGLTAITQLPSLIPRQILANMNTKIILGVEMKPERQAIIESASQDLSNDDRNIASLDTGEAIITSNFARFATPIKIPFFDNLKKENKENIKKDFSGIDLG